MSTCCWKAPRSYVKSSPSSMSCGDSIHWLTSHSPVAGAPEKISQLRERYQQLSQNIAHYEDRVARNSAQLGTLNQRKGYDSTSHQDHEDEEADIATPAPAQFMSQEDLEHEELEIRDLERKKKGLEERVTGMEKDLGGLMR